MHRYIDALVSDDFGRQSLLTHRSANAFARKKLDSASQSLQLRTEQREKASRRTEAREYAAAERGLQAELRESDRRIRLMWRSLNTKVRPEKKLQHTPPRERNRLWPFASAALPKYDGPVLDRLGQRGVFVRMRYYSRRTAEQGVSQRVVKYVFNGAECDVDGEVYQFSNVGLTIDETLCAFDHLEQVNWSAAKNAKLMIHSIFAVDHRQTTDEMMECGTRWAEETLGRFDLPYLVTLHAPPLDGDARNWHLHILWSFRPMVRTGDHEWQVGEMLRSDLDNPAAMRAFREMYAHVMTDVSFEAGQRQVYTAKSNAERGLPHEPQAHLGGAKTNRARGGEYVADNEENHERVQRSKAAVIDDDLRHADEAITREQAVLRAIAGRWARVSSLPMRVAERAIAATFSASLPDVGTVPARSSVGVVIPAASPANLAKSTRVTLELVTSHAAPRRALDPDLVATLPANAVQPTRLEIANLRNGALRPAITAIDRTVTLPSAPRRPAVTFTLPPVAVAGAPPRASIELARATPLPVKARSAAPSIPALSPIVSRPSTFSLSIERAPRMAAVPSIIHVAPPTQPPPLLADRGTIERIFRRIDEARKADEARCKREREKADRAARVAEAAKVEQQALERLMVALEEERHYLALEQGRPTIDAALLSDFNVSADALSDDAVRARLNRIADRNSGELSRIQDYVTKHPDQLRDEADHWVLRDTAPADVRALVSAWRNDRTVQTALARVAGAKPVMAAVVGIRDDTTAPPTSAWRRARHLRERAMAKWDVARRSDRSEVLLPGIRLAQPGEDRSVQRPGGARRIDRLPGSGLGE